MKKPFRILLPVVIAGAVVSTYVHNRVNAPTQISTVGAVFTQDFVSVPTTNLTYPFVPDSVMTPGDVLTTDAEKVSQPGYAKSVRNVSGSLKRKIYLSYGITSHKSGEYEIDHLVSLELGGSNDAKNLWPQPYHGHWNAHMKDELENKFHNMVAKGQLDLTVAQKEMALNWVAAYQKYIGDGEQSRYWGD